MKRSLASGTRLVASIAALAVILGATDASADRRRRRRGRKPAAPAAQPAESPATSPSPSTTTSTSTTTPTSTPKGSPKAKGKDQVFDFTGLELAGSMRMPQLLYFLDRAEEELERASLERRSFVPAMVRSIDEEAL